MKKSIHALFSLGALVLATFAAQAQPAPRILVVDMAKLLENHYDTVAEKAKLEEASKKAKEQIDTMSKEIDTGVAEYKELDERSKNPTATLEAKTKAAADAQKLGQDIQSKVNDRNTFANNARATINERIQNFRATTLEEISKTVASVAKSHGTNLVWDKSGASLLGIPPIVYVDAGFDITDEVMAEINGSRPANDSTAPTSSSPSTMPMAPSPGSDAPKIKVPGVMSPSK